jgi:hypothetical protein
VLRIKRRHQLSRLLPRQRLLRAPRDDLIVWVIELVSSWYVLREFLYLVCWSTCCHPVILRKAPISKSTGCGHCIIVSMNKLCGLEFYSKS